MRFEYEGQVYDFPEHVVRALNRLVDSSSLLAGPMLRLGIEEQRVWSEISRIFAEPGTSMHDVKSGEGFRVALNDKLSELFVTIPDEVTYPEGSDTVNSDVTRLCDAIVLLGWECVGCTTVLGFDRWRFKRPKRSRR